MTDEQRDRISGVRLRPVPTLGPVFVFVCLFPCVYGTGAKSKRMTKRKRSFTSTLPMNLITIFLRNRKLKPDAILGLVGPRPSGLHRRKVRDPAIGEGRGPR